MLFMFCQKVQEQFFVEQIRKISQSIILIRLKAERCAGIRVIV